MTAPTGWRRAALILAGGALLLACSLAAGAGLVGFLQAQTDPHAQERRLRQQFPALALQDATAPPGAAALQATHRARLNVYEWVDREAGIARIPIERAMTLMIEGSGEAGSE